MPLINSTTITSPGGKNELTRDTIPPHNQPHHHHRIRILHTPRPTKPRVEPEQSRLGPEQSRLRPEQSRTEREWNLDERPTREDKRHKRLLGNVFAETTIHGRDHHSLWRQNAVATGTCPDAGCRLLALREMTSSCWSRCSRWAGARRPAH